MNCELEYRDVFLIEQAYEDVNRISIDVSCLLNNIYTEYIYGDDDFPYERVCMILDKYNKECNFVENFKYKILSDNISRGRLSDMREYKFPSYSDIRVSISNICLKYIDINYDKYIPIDTDSYEYIKNRLLIIMRYAYPYKIALLYKELKNRVMNMNIIDKDNVLYLLQNLYVYFISMSCLEHDHHNSFLKYIYSYDDICRIILKEKSLIDDDIKRKCLVSKKVSLE